ncbi:MAG TPA: type I-B CRISPR-associated protein Cas8b1/Cst1 [Desulfobacteraceae bacterium]|nr:type I-B CRISPR-associated protein Cas8b1/Cst1 [Desulfobacteraceae bacterium]
MEQMTQTLTGDPFVDMGGVVMNSLTQQTVEGKIRFITDVYVDHWKGKINSVFLHSKITTIHATGKPKRQRDDSLKYYLEFLQGKGNVIDGYCRICSSKGPLFEGGRDNFPLVGSGEFTNFYHSQEPGLLICKDCLIKLYFLPLGLLQSGGNLMFLQIQNEYTERLWREDIILKNLDKIHRGSSEGILKSIYGRSFANPRNALFFFSSKLIERFQLYDHPSQQLRLFYFTNFGSKPDAEIYDLPSPVFAFLKRVLKPDLRADWHYFVKKHYRFRKSVHFDAEAGEWVEVKKKIATKLEINDYEGTNSNTIYDRLLAGKSILWHLREVYKSRRFPIYLAIAYLKEVKKMKQEQIDLIRKISDKIIALCRKERDYKKFITPLEGARYGYQLRSAITRMVKVHYKDGEPEPFIRFNDYVEYLFPDGQNWYEVRDFLLICLYEKLHDLRIAPDEIPDEPISEIEEIERQSIEAFNQ